MTTTISTIGKDAKVYRNALHVWAARNPFTAMTVGFVIGLATQLFF